MTVATTPALRPQTKNDEEFLRNLFTSRRADLLFAAIASEELRKLLDLQFDARRRHYASGHPDAEWLIIEEDGRPVGEVIVDRDTRVITLVDITVRPEAQGRGVGAAVLRRIVREASENRQRVRLTVARNNPARRLYERMGFRPTGGSELDLVLETPLP